MTLAPICCTSATQRSNDTKGRGWVPIADPGVDLIKGGVSRVTHGHLHGNGGIPLTVAAVHQWLIPFCRAWQDGHRPHSRHGGRAHPLSGGNWLVPWLRVFPQQAGPIAPRFLPVPTCQPGHFLPPLPQTVQHLDTGADPAPLQVLCSPANGDPHRRQSRVGGLRKTPDDAGPDGAASSPWRR